MLCTEDCEHVTCSLFTLRRQLSVSTCCFWQAPRSWTQHPWQQQQPAIKEGEEYTAGYYASLCFALCFAESFAEAPARSSCRLALPSSASCRTGGLRMTQKVNAYHLTSTITTPDCSRLCLELHWRCLWFKLLESQKQKAHCVNVEGIESEPIARSWFNMRKNQRRYLHPVPSHAQCASAHTRMSARP